MSRIHLKPSEITRRSDYWWPWHGRQQRRQLLPQDAFLVGWGCELHLQAGNDVLHLIDGKPATTVNGGMIGIAAASREHVLAWHEAGTAIESPPAERPNGAFVAYLRDPDGNKLTARTRPTS